ncbi:MAG TPA: ABC transporter permease [Gemmatimonadaceae bacterium]|nr:ABC transporter permease [Gemmatimonadaceae bacterium]
MARLTRILNTFRRRRLDRDIDAELAFHIEMRAREYERSGMTSVDARREAVRRVGNPLMLRDRTRDVDVVVRLETAWLDARYAARALLRTPGFAVAAILTLALGIGANTALFAIVYGILLQPLPYAEADKLYMVYQTSESVGRTRAAPLDFLDWRERTRAFAGMAAHGGSGFTLSGGSDPEFIIGQLVSAELFDVLGVRPMLGRAFRQEENEAGRNYVVILGHRLWMQRFGGDPNAVGRTIIANGRPFTVIGVMPSGFAYPSTRYELWTPFPFRGSNSDNLPVNRESRYLQVIARLRPTITAAQAQADMNDIAQGLAQQFPDTHAKRGIGISSLLDETVGEVRRAVWLVFAGATLVFLIACTNVTSLLLARFTVRERELGVRTALGASRPRLIRQIVVEMLILYGTSAVAGVLLAYGLLKVVVALAPANLPRVHDVALLSPVIAFTFIITFVAALIFGLLPAWHALRRSSHRTTRALTSRGSTGGPRQQRARTVVLIAQVALAVVLVAGAGLAVRSLVNLQRVQKGFDPADVVTFDVMLPASRFPDGVSMQAFYRRLLETFESDRQFKAVGATTHLPLSGQDFENSFRVAGYSPPSPEATPVAGVRGISPGYLAAMGIPLRRGRNITAEDREGTQPVVLVNESFARKYLSGVDALGGQLSMGDSDPWRTVVGIIADLKHRGLDADAHPEVLIPFPQLDPFILTAFARGLSVVIRSDGAPEGVIAAARDHMRAADAAIPVITPRPLNELVMESLGQPRFRVLLLGAFGLLALVLALVGTFGLMSYFVTQRRHEFGIKIALGATPAGVLRSVVLHGTRIIAAGLAIGTAAALILTRSMQAILYGVQSNDALTLVSAIALLGVAGAVACYWPARRATLVNPVEAIRRD